MKLFKTPKMVIACFSFLAIFLFTNISHSAQTNPIFLKALLASSNNGNGYQFPKTYYKSGEFLIIWAWFLPVFLWGVPLDGRPMNINYKVIIDGVTVADMNRTLAIDNLNYVGVSTSVQLPANLTNGASGTVTVTITVPDFEVIVGGDGITSPPPMNQSNIFIDNGNFKDITCNFSNFIGDASQTFGVWQGMSIGNCQDDTKLWNKGSATTCKAFIFNFLARKYFCSPGSLNYILTMQNGYIMGANGFNWCCPSNETVIINGITKPMNLIGAPGVTRWDGCVESDIHNFLPTIDKNIANNLPVMIETNKNGQQYFVVVGKRESGEWNLFDPWDGQAYTMSKAGITHDMISKIYFFNRVNAAPYLLLIN
jgi:hypothetical protein